MRAKQLLRKTQPLKLRLRRRKAPLPSRDEAGGLKAAAAEAGLREAAADAVRRAVRMTKV